MFFLILHLLWTVSPTNALSLSATGANNVSSAWFAGWGTGLDTISWQKYSQVTYAFAETTPDVNVVSLEASNPDQLPKFVALAHENNVKALLSIGGWTGSQYFSSNVATAANRTAFVKTITTLATKYTLDGIDFDWEYPGKQGVGCNVVSPNDTANFLLLLQELKQDPVGQTLELSAAAGIHPWAGNDGTPSLDLSPFANVLDFIAVMDYDIWGTWATGVGPNAPLNDSCTTSPPQNGSAASAMHEWIAAGIPRDQLVLGVASYGHSFTVTPSIAFGSTTKSAQRSLVQYPVFSINGPGEKDQCGNVQHPPGTLTFGELVANNYLSKNGTAKISTNGSLTYRFDECSQTPYIYDETAQLMISYDDATSSTRKGDFIRVNSLRGFAMWDAAGDYNDILLDAYLSGMVNGDPTAANLSIGSITLNSASSNPNPNSNSSSTKPSSSSSGNGALRTLYSVDIHWLVVMLLLAVVCV